MTPAHPEDGGAPTPEAVAECLRTLRQAAGLSQRDLARRLERTQAWVEGREAGRTRVDPGEFIAWCRACGAHPPEALAGLLRATEP